MPKVAQNRPAVANSRSPPTPWLPMVVIDSMPNTMRPAIIVAPPSTRCPVGRSPSTSVARISPDSAAQAGWMVVPWPSGTSMKPV